jgi:uncharacterized protein YtpQ (UPF0354 family)
MGILFWRGRVSKANFRRLFVAALREQAPELTCSESADDELVVTIGGTEEYAELTQRLHNAYLEFQKNPSEKAGIIERWVKGTVALASPLVITRDGIVPMLKSREWVENAAPPGEICVEPYNDELSVVYAHWGDSIHFLVNADLDEAGIARADLRSLALTNLRRMTPQRDFIEQAGVWLVNVGGNFEATMLVDDSFWADPRFAHADSLLVAVPDRNTIIISTDDSAEAVWNLAFFANNLYRSESYPISNQIFVRRGGWFYPLDLERRDESHPIPDLDVLDVHALLKTGGSEMALIIATPMDADPRSVFRLFQKLSGYLQFVDTGEYRTQAGDGDTRVEVNIHPGSDAAVFELLATIPQFIEKPGVKFAVKCIE